MSAQVVIPGCEMEPRVGLSTELGAHLRFPVSRSPSPCFCVRTLCLSGKQRNKKEGIKERKRRRKKRSKRTPVPRSFLSGARQNIKGKRCARGKSLSS